MTKQLIKLLAIGLLGLLVFSCGGKNTEQQPESTATQNDLYPTVTIRQIMSALKMKPLKKERWETVFDRRII